MFRKRATAEEEAIRQNEEWLNGGFERHEARVVTGAILITFAISGLVWYLSIERIGYWWTVLLAEMLGN